MSTFKFCYAVTGLKIPAAIKRGRALSSKEASIEEAKRIIAIRHRCWAICESETDAIGGLNHCPECVHDGDNNYAVIEKFNFGMWAMCHGEKWFKWDKKSETWKKCKKPRITRGICHWSMG